MKCRVNGSNSVRLGETLTADILVGIKDKHGNDIKKVVYHSLWFGISHYVDRCYSSGCCSLWWLLHDLSQTKHAKFSRYCQFCLNFLKVLSVCRKEELIPGNWLPLTVSYWVPVRNPVSHLSELAKLTHWFNIFLLWIPVWERCFKRSHHQRWWTGGSGNSASSGASK